MEPYAFVAEVYRRMTLGQTPRKEEIWRQMENDPIVAQAAYEYAVLLERHGVV